MTLSPYPRRAASALSSVGTAGLTPPADYSDAAVCGPRRTPGRAEHLCTVLSLVWQPVVLKIRPAILDCNVLTLDETSLIQALAERSDKVRGAGSRRAPNDNGMGGCARAPSGMTRSNVVGCSTGRSAGLAPRKILSMNSAAR